MASILAGVCFRALTIISPSTPVPAPTSRTLLSRRLQCCRSASTQAFGDANPSLSNESVSYESAHFSYAPRTSSLGVLNLVSAIFSPAPLVPSALIRTCDLDLASDAFACVGEAGPAEPSWLRWPPALESLFAVSLDMDTRHREPMDCTESDVCSAPRWP